MAKTPAKRKPGQPRKFDRHEVFDRICGILATTSRSLRDVCSDPSLPDVMTIIRWMNADDDLMKMYVQAREAQADVVFDEIIEIADGKRPIGEEDDIVDVLVEDGMSRAEAVAYITKLQPHVVSRDKLRVDARKYAASKLKPGTYGDKVVGT
ncbi:MAG: hypothetical protein R3185_04645, partial [Candidatus Thermoplasmatota archaeon]|nr:hypothetical protein [Candidatus Thermoplasmatota archaeon]